ncbi:Hypothetical Protein FCC1311_019932 [Hondaea fermentalgiana]|uniref:GDP-fucose protein O-fucosyltransferase 2 n=1 Tax=Hondaea fermentalgiana TaxID=2315210 RepID=A0A2R5GD92_9STRA|nr:Hypothetical Protein FCC1311_019932 [Hondaea fermentalgiana]|eukprot:GBG25774.1 Hypothetical Protein FCC1311_019932 [Hondaea fermentalgiana]
MNWRTRAAKYSVPLVFSVLTVILTLHKSASLLQFSANVNESTECEDCFRHSNTLGQGDQEGTAYQYDWLGSPEDNDDSSKSAAQDLGDRRPSLDEVMPRTTDVKYGVLDSTKKYYVYTPSGGLGNQVICLASALFIAQSLGRELIVPMASGHLNLAFRYLAADASSLLAADRLFDFPAMVNTLGIDLVPIDVRLVDFIASLDSNEVETVDIQSPLLTPNVLRARAHMQLLKNADAAHVVFSKGRFFSYHWLRYSMWSSVRYAPALQEIASLVHAEVFEGEPFSAVHVRLGDVANMMKTQMHSAEAFAQALQKVHVDEADPLFVATVAKSSHTFLAPLMKRTGRKIFSPDLFSGEYPQVKEALDQLKTAFAHPQLFGSVAAALEQLICTHAATFIGTSTSTFTKHITIMRRNLPQTLSSRGLKMLDVPSTVRHTASVHVDGRLTTFEWSKPGVAWHDERWFMKKGQVDNGSNSNSYVW